MKRLAKLMCVVAAFWGIPVMNTQAADSTAWLGAMSGSRPLLLRKENPSRGFDSNAVHGDWSSQDADRIVAKHTGMVLSGSFSWENSYSAADGERVDTCSFTADDGSVNRFSVLSYRSALSPYAWTSDSGKAGENFDPVEFVRSRFNAEGTSSISWMGRLVSAADVEIRELGEAIAVPWDKYYFFLVDDLPGANWSHPCRYVFLSEDGSSFAVLYKQNPPRFFSASDGSRIYLKAAETQDESMEKDAAKQLNAVTSKVYSYANSLREENDLSYSTGNKSKSHFVLICGGGDPQSNGIRFWCDTAMLYSTLTLKYGVSKDHIHVYMSDGESTDADANLASTSSGVTPVLVSSPLDLDGDGYSDIDGAATKSGVRSCFNSLASSLSSSDQLFVFITSHGSTSGTSGPNNYDSLAWLYAADGGSYGSDGERAYFWDEDLAEWTSGMACPVAFAIETCYSGGFIDDITQTPKRVIATACNHYETSYGSSGGGAWKGGTTGKTTASNCWARELISAFRGVHPRNLPDKDGYYYKAYPWEDDTDISIDADSDGDGLVSFSEARAYANENDSARCTLSTHTSTCGKDNNVEHPQYAESTGGLGNNFFMLKQTSSNLEDLEINIVSGLTSGSCSVENDGSTWKIVESFPSWVKGVSFYCSTNGNLMSLASNGTTIGFSGIATMTVSCTTNDTSATRSWNMTISNRTTKAIQYLVHVRQEPYSSVSVPVATQISIPSTYGYYGNTSYIQMTWTNVANATSYNVYRSESSSSSGRSKIATNVTSPYKDYATTSSLVPGKKYWYWVEAVNSAGSSFSNSDWGNILVSASLSKTTLGFTAAGGTSNITVTANTSWTATKSDSWLSLSTSGTSGNGSIAVTVTANTNTTSRTGRIVVTAGAGTTYPKVVTNVVTQAAGMSLATALDNTTLSFTTGGHSSWAGQSSTSHDSVDAAQSGALGNSQTNWLQTTVSGPGTISFWWYVSSEQGYDYLEFLIDGSVKDSMSGTNNVWTSKSFTISTSGEHTLQWRYRKDSSQYRGLDAGFVDQVTWTPSTSPTSTTYTVTYQLNGGTHGATHPSSATYDTAFYVSAPTKSGYTFTGWTVTSGLNTSTAKWGTSSNPSTTISSSSTKCVNGATGNVYFKNLTTTANGSVTLTANWTSSALPDLCPYTPVGWSGSLVLSTESQNATNSTATSFSPNDAIYVSLAVVNLGEGFSNDFNWALYVDDSLRTTGANWGSGLAANGSSRWFALSIGPLPTGTHTIKVVYDYTGLISESNESNNTVTKTVTVSGVVVRPSNDNFAGATTISGMSGLVTGSNVNATYESGEPLPNISAGATNTIWWTWTAPATGIAQFSTAGSKVSSTAMGAYVGSSVSALTTVSAYTQSSISFAVVSGTRYYIAVSGTGYRYQGTIKLNWSMFTPVPLNTALDNASLTFTTGGAASWVGVTNESYVGGSSARSGAISHSQSTWMQTEVSGKGTLSFWYKVSSESYCDKLIFYIDGVQKTTASGTGTAGWSRFECVFSNNTQHVVKWTYSKDGSVSSGSDCCWIDKVEWTPAGGSGDVTVDVGGGKSVTVPGTWLAEKTTRAVTAVAANGRKVWECYVVGLDPEIATSDFKLTSFPMKADGTPDLEHIVFEPPQARWNVPATWKVKGATTLDGPWGGVPAGGNPAYRFFKVEVVLP